MGLWFNASQKEYCASAGCNPCALRKSFLYTNYDDLLGGLSGSSVRPCDVFFSEETVRTDFGLRGGDGDRGLQAALGVPKECLAGLGRDVVSKYKTYRYHWSRLRKLPARLREKRAHTQEPIDSFVREAIKQYKKDRKLLKDWAKGQEVQISRRENMSLSNDKTENVSRNTTATGLKGILKKQPQEVIQELGSTGASNDSQPRLRGGLVKLPKASFRTKDRILQCSIGFDLGGRV